MSSRPLFRPQIVANAIDMSDADSYSSISNINMVSTIGYTVSWTDGAAGDFTVEVSNDYIPPGPNVLNLPPNDGHWVPLTLSSSVSSDGSADAAYIDVVGISAAWIRLHFHKTSSTGGTYTAVVAGKAQ